MVADLLLAIFSSLFKLKHIVQSVPPQVSMVKNTNDGDQDEYQLSCNIFQKVLTQFFQRQTWQVPDVNIVSENSNTATVGNTDKGEKLKFKLLIGFK